MTQPTDLPMPTPLDACIRAALEDAGVRKSLQSHAILQLRMRYDGLSTAHRDQVADELVDETFGRALVTCERFDPRRSAIAWLHGILTIVLLEYAKRRSRQPRQLDNSEIPSPDVVEHFENQEWLARMLKQLNPDERNLIEWAIMEEQSHQQIADRLQITEGASRIRLYRILNKMRRRSQEEER